MQYGVFKAIIYVQNTSMQQIIDLHNS